MSEPFAHKEDSRKRGKAKPSSQLSRLNFEILEYLHTVSMEMMQTAQGKQQLEKVGIPWSAKRFCATTGKEINASTRATISGSLASLVKRSGLLTASRIGVRTTHVKLTSQATAIVGRGQFQGVSTELMKMGEDILFLGYFADLNEAKMLVYGWRFALMPLKNPSILNHTQNT